MISPKIGCAVCGTPVQRVEVWDDLKTMDIVVRAYCHGKMDEMRLSVRDIERMTCEQLSALFSSNGKAFSNDKLLPAFNNNIEEMEGGEE